MRSVSFQSNWLLFEVSSSHHVLYSFVNIQVWRETINNLKNSELWLAVSTALTQEKGAINIGGLYPPTVTKPTKPRGSCARRQNLKKCAAHGGRVKSYNH